MVSVGARWGRRYKSGVCSVADILDADVELRRRDVGSRGELAESSEVRTMPIPGARGLTGRSPACGIVGSVGVVSSRRQDSASTPASKTTVPTAMRPPCKALRRDAWRKYIRPSKIAMIL